MGQGVGSGRGPKNGPRGGLCNEFRVIQMIHMVPWGPRGRVSIAFLIDDIILGAPQGVYVHSGERQAPWGSCFVKIAIFDGL